MAEFCNPPAVAARIGRQKAIVALARKLLCWVFYER
jgi:hypothetical protein